MAKTEQLIIENNFLSALQGGVFIGGSKWFLEAWQEGLSRSW